MCDANDGNALSGASVMSSLPEGAGTVQLSVHFSVFRDQPGGCAVTFSAVPGSELVETYGGAGPALEACREAIISDLNVLIREFRHEVATS